MNDKDLNKKLLDIMEYGMGPEMMPGAVAPSAEPKVEGSVEFKQHKNTDKGSVSIEASGETLQDLADVLKLAGLTLPDAMKPSERPEEKPEEKPEEEPKADDHDHEDGEECDACAGEIDDPSYTTDKQAIIDRLRDTLKAKLIR